VADEQSQATHTVTVFDKAEGDALGAVHGNAFVPEDAFSKFYRSAKGDTAHILQPPYNVAVLHRKTQENNALGPCIEAMVTNIDGTGYVFERKDGSTEDADDDARITALEEFFEQPYPGVSFTTQRKNIRRDQEAIGYGVAEVIRNPKDEIVFLRHVDAKTVRLVALDAPVRVKKAIRRGGKEVSVDMMVRERRFAQVIDTETVVYFKELGASRDVDKKTGEWAQSGQRLPYHQRGSELMVFGAIPDAHTPYHVPRWVPQLPSVLGSREAEELNLEFFENGGLPPLMVLLQGGTLAEDARKALEKILNGKAKTKMRGAVLEAISTSGSLDAGGNVRVSVERFGSERQSDSMFENYDEKCERRVRRAFRLPPMFVGQAADYSFATAFASYTVAEAQVFKPERDEFDEIISTRLLPEMGYPDYRMRSLPLQVHDATLKMHGIQAATQVGVVNHEDLIGAINEATNLELKVDDDMASRKREDALAPTPSPLDGGFSGPNGGYSGSMGAPKPVTKSEGLHALAKEAMIAMRTRDPERMVAVSQEVLSLSKDERERYRQAMAVEMFLDDGYDPEGLAELSVYTYQALQQAAE
jgi:PBSX family phage portal protein